MPGTVTDTHCHLDRYEDTDAVVARAGAAGVTVHYVTFLPSQYLRERERFAGRPEVVLGLGFHPMASRGQFPWEPEIDLDAEIALYPQLSADAVWIGEVGLDFTPDGAPFRARQEQMMDAVLAAPTVSEKLLTIHSRAAERELVDRLVAAGVTRAAFHGNGFTGTVAHLDHVLAAGYSFSIVPSMFFDDRGRALIAAIPRDRALLESDGPFGIVDDRALEPGDLVPCCARLAEVWETDEDAVRRQLADNLAALRTW